MNRHSLLTLTSICFLFTILAYSSALGQIALDSGEYSPPTTGTIVVETAMPATFENVRLTSSSGEAVKPHAVANLNNLYVVWEDTRDGSREVYWQKFERSTGSAATPPVRLTMTGTIADPAIGIDAAGNSYVVWEYKGGNLYGSIYAMKIDGVGNTLIPAFSVSSNLSISPDIAVEPSGVSWICYHRMAPTDQDVYMQRHNSSLTQTCRQRRNTGTIPGRHKTPVVASDGSNGWVFWYDLGTFFQNYNVIQVFSPTCGYLGQAVHENFIHPAVGSCGGGVWAAMEASGNVYDLLGTNSATQVNDVSGRATYPSVEADGTYGYFAWQDTRDGNSEIYVSKGLNNQLFADVRVSNNTAASQYPEIAMSCAEPGIFWIVWQDNRDGNWEVYMASTECCGASHLVVDPTSIDLGTADQNGLVPPAKTFSIRNTGAGTLNWSVDRGAADWLTISPDEGNTNEATVSVAANTTCLAPGTYNATLTINSTNADNPGQTVAVTYAVRDVPYHTLQVKSSAEEGAVIADHDVKLQKIADDGTESAAVDYRTDGNGVIHIPESDLTESERFLVVCSVGVFLTDKGSHEAVDNVAFKVTIDNMSFDTEYAPQFSTLTPCGPTRIVLDHTTLWYNLLVAVRWNAPSEYLDEIAASLRTTDNFLYDVFNGQVRLGEVQIVDNAWSAANWQGTDFWSPADVQVNADNFYGDVASANPRKIEAPTRIVIGRVNFPRTVYGGDRNANRNLTSQIHPDLWNSPLEPFGDPNDPRFPWPTIRTLTHELCHALVAFGDEYHCNGRYNFGLMDGDPQIWNRDDKSAELSTAADYSDASHHCGHANSQWHMWSKSCWESFKDLVEDQDMRVGSIPYMLKLPSDLTAGVSEVYAGPNDNLTALNYDVGRDDRLRIEIQDSPQGQTFDQKVTVSSFGSPLVRGIVNLRKGSDEFPIRQGETADDGSIWVLGADCGDVLHVYTMTVGPISWIQPRLTYFEDDICSINSSRTPSALSRDSLVIPLKELSGNIAFLPSIRSYSGDGLELDVQLPGASFNPIAIRCYSESGLLGSASFAGGPLTYTAPAMPIAGSGQVFVQCQDSLGEPFSLPLEFDVTEFGGSLHPTSSATGCMVFPDSASSAVTRSVVVSSPFSSLWNGFGPGALRVGNVWSVGLQPAGSAEGSTRFSYRQDGLSPEEELLIRAYKWDNETVLWQPLLSSLDTATNDVMVASVESGTYALFTTGRLRGASTIDPNWIPPAPKMELEILVGNLSGAAVDDIDLSTVRINGALIPGSMSVLSSAPGFTGEVLHVTTTVLGLSSTYPDPYDPIVQSYYISGYLSSGAGFVAEGQLSFYQIYAGDVNGSGTTDVTDLSEMVDYLFGGDTRPSALEKGDMDRNGVVDLSDITALIEVIFQE